MIVVVAWHAVIHIIIPKKPYIDETIEIFVETVPGRIGFEFNERNVYVVASYAFKHT